MNENKSELIEVNQLRTGLFVELDVGWLMHPFPSGSFKISSVKQIEIIRSLGLKRIRYLPHKSDSLVLDEREAEASAMAANGDAVAADLMAREGVAAEESRRRQANAEFIDAQRRYLLACERHFREATFAYKDILESLRDDPRRSKDRCLGLIGGFVDDMTCNDETAIRLLSEGSSERAAIHSVNVTVISLLLGKAMGLSKSEMVDLGVAAILHDIGKQALPDRLRWHEEDDMSPVEYKVYQEHVSLGVEQARRMGLSDGVVMAIAQHHEKFDGSGFPSRLKGDQLSLSSKILVLVNRYESLCNPSRPLVAMTPHEALSMMFSQFRMRFDSVVLSAFIRMMGVYPPGSVIQLMDDRYALVVSVNSSRPLKPRVIVYDPCVPRQEALILDLETTPEQGIRRSIKPASLPPDAKDYLFPRQRICYFFQRDADTLPQTHN